MLKIVITTDRFRDREECEGYYTLFLTPALVEEFYYVSRNMTLGDLVAMPRFALRRPTHRPFRLAGYDGPNYPSISIRFGLPKFLVTLRSAAIEQKVEFVH